MKRVVLVLSLLTSLTIQAPAEDVGVKAQTGSNKTFAIADENIRRDDGEVASYLFNATLTLLYTERKQALLLDFEHINRWQGEFFIEDLAVVAIDKMGRRWEFVRLPYYYILDHCYYKPNER